MDISQSFAKINKIPIPSSSHEMELVLSINPDIADIVQDATKTESSF